MNKLYYLAYGSNLHPLRLMKRVPSATRLGMVVLADSKVLFHKRSIDGSGKCMLLKDEINKPLAYGALFSIDPSEEALLDKAEGLGKGYLKKLIQCPVVGREYSAFTYVAESKAIDSSLKPYHWYKALVIEGAHYHGFPQGYISALMDLESIPDPNEQRRMANDELLSELRLF
jgi:gamma-glutamylcyclotransferase